MPLACRAGSLLCINVWNGFHDVPLPRATTTVQPVRIDTIVLSTLLQGMLACLNHPSVDSSVCSVSTRYSSAGASTTALRYRSEVSSDVQNPASRTKRSFVQKPGSSGVESDSHYW